MAFKKYHSRPAPGKRNLSDSSSEKNGKGKIFFSEKRITIETSDGSSYYVFHTRAIGYIHGDLVEFIITRPSKNGKLAEVRPVRLLKRSEEELLMEVRLSHGKIIYKILTLFGGGVVRCEVSPPDTKDGDIFIVRYTDSKIVRVLRYFGSENDLSVMEDIILFRARVRREWPKELENLKIAPSPQLAKVTDSPLQDALNLTKNIPNSTKLLGNDIFNFLSNSETKRLDLRSWPTMTIDGADAKDLDDAISIARYENGDLLLGVHIADVAEYVIEDTPLDREAYLRGTSIYTPGRVIPMLPEILSNDRCSLHPGSPKLTLSILLRVDSIGQVKESHVTESVIESTKRGIYDDIFEELQKRESGGGTQLDSFSSLYTILAARRKKEGKILFETTECYFKLDEDRNIKDIKKRDRNDAHMMIEEFMVLANEEVAKWCAEKKVPFLSRVHDVPGTEQSKAIAEILDNPLLANRVEPGDIEKALRDAPNPTEHYRLSRLLLPKMAKAVYKEKVDRHFGLALKYYAHFTSPIRRYPDLLLHRMIKKHLRHTFATAKSSYEQNMKKWGLSLSEKERSAEEVARAVDALFMCRYMSDKVGKTYDGIISGLTESNIYVELESGVEGSIFLGRGLSSYTLDPIRGSLRDASGKEIYRIGESVRIKITEVNMQTRRIEMSI